MLHTYSYVQKQIVTISHTSYFPTPKKKICSSSKDLYITESWSFAQYKHAYNLCSPPLIPTPAQIILNSVPRMLKEIYFCLLVCLHFKSHLHSLGYYLCISHSWAILFWIVTLKTYFKYSAHTHTDILDVCHCVCLELRIHPTHCIGKTLSSGNWICSSIQM